MNLVFCPSTQCGGVYFMGVGWEKLNQRAVEVLKKQVLNVRYITCPRCKPPTLTLKPEKVA